MTLSHDFDLNGKIHLNGLPSDSQRKIRGEFIYDYFVHVGVNLADAEKYLEKRRVFKRGTLFKAIKLDLLGSRNLFLPRT